MIRWAPYAIVRVVAFFAFGILLAIYFPFHETVRQVIWVCWLSSFSYILCWLLFKRKRFIRYNILVAITGSITFMTLGYFNLVVADRTEYKHHLTNFKNREAYTFRILDNGEEKAKTVRYLAEVLSVKDSAWYNASGKLFLYVKKEIEQPQLGQVYLLSGSPKPILAPMNPGEFDYRRFLSFKHIYFQQFVHSPLLQISEDRAVFSLMNIGYAISEWGQAVFDDFIPNAQNKSISLALVLGVKDGLDNEIKNAYSASGAMHILAVSGLHVGIIYLVINLLFGKMQSRAFGRWFFALFSLMVLWMYALVTGFSPSVSRAVTMFSFVIVAKAIDRKSNIYNTLAASALVLLFFDPHLIMSVGFQLSYLAVLGIVFLQPWIYKLVIINHYLLDKIWAITAVSIAAQLATFPLGLLYFHQFPTFFLLSNLVVIPAAFVILAGGLFLLFTSWIPSVAAIVGAFLNGLISLVNSVVFWIEDIPYSKLEDIYISTGQSWLIILMIVCLSALFVTKRKLFFYPALTFCFLLLYAVISRQLDHQQVNKITFYKINGSTAVEWIKNRSALLYTDSALMKNAGSFRFHVKPNRLRSGVLNSKIALFDSTLVSGVDIVHMGGKSILILGKVDRRITLKEKLRVDFIVYTGRAWIGLDWVKRNFDTTLLVIGGDMSQWKADKVLKECEALGLTHYSVYHEGALEYNI